MRLLRCGLFLTMSLLAHAETVKLEVNFKLTDMEYKPIAGAPARLILGVDQDWQAPGAGMRVVTDAAGETHYTAEVKLEKKWRSENVGFTGLSVPTRTDHLAIAVELQPAVAEGKYSWLYTMNVYCNSGGDCSTDDIEDVYSKDGKGRFTVKAKRIGDGPPYGWMMPELNGMAMNGTGFQTFDHLLSFDKERKVWTLKLAFKRAGAPVRR